MKGATLPTSFESCRFINLSALLPFILVFQVAHSASELMYESPLVIQLMKNASKYVRPVKNQNMPTNVTFRLNLYQILGADTVNQNIHLHFWAEMLWINDFIQWNPDEYEQITRLDFEQKFMWVPDIMFFNQLSGLHFNEHFPAPPAIFSNGMILVLKPFRVELQCKLKVLHFPFDRQECAFDVGSWAHPMDEIDIQPSMTRGDPETGEGAVVNAADLSFFTNSSLFTLAEFSVEKFYYSDPELDNRTFSSLRYTVRFYRVAAYFVINLIMPSLMINVLCMLNFAIPCSSGEKVGYGITVFLAQSVNLMVVMEMMPQGGMSILGIFLAVSILLIGLSLLMNVITLRIYSPSHTKERPWPRLRSICNKLKVLVGPNDPLPDIVLARRQMTFVSNSLKESDFDPGNYSDDDDDSTAMFKSQVSTEVKIAKNSAPTIPNGRMNSHKTSEFLYPDSIYFSSNNGRSSTTNVPHYEQIPGSFTTHNSLNHVLSPRLTKKSLSTSAKRKRKQSVASPNFRLVNRRLEPADTSANVMRTQQLDDDDDEDEERDYTLEWQQHAEIINRFNALIFSLLLILNGILYALFHSPEADLVSD